MPVVVSTIHEALSMPDHNKAVNSAQFAVISVQFRPNFVVAGRNAHAPNGATCRIGTTTVVSERLTT
jgi:hypothetical protein